MLSGEAVRTRKFTTVRGFREGYSMAEVDVFLEQVAVALDELRSQIQQQVDATPSAAAARILELAQQTADSHVHAAEQQAKAQIEGLRHQVEALNARIAELQQIEREYRNRLKDFIASHLDEL
ncbi:MAG: DivIVA domain-containing protein [Actinobacteria bacterium]|nr:DivIVA domain-containing protein [Actinomycetota bacterium]